MRFDTFASSASALLVLTTAVHAKHSLHQPHEVLHRRHRLQPAKEVKKSQSAEGDTRKRSGTCQFPTNVGLVAVTPESANAGWAMSPDQVCTPGSYCPYACPPGQVSMQWDPSATSYTYPQSMNGGLYCDSNGNVTKPFPNRPYCEATEANIGVVNNASGVVSFCQTVLPGNEAMLIPTAVEGFSTLANPGMDYWCGTAAHYYINPPGTDTTQACVWGTNNSPVGNWSPYVAGSNVDATGITYIKLGWNPVYLEQATPFRNVMPSWGVEIVCPNGGCSGLPCSIDPNANQVNGMSGSSISTGAGGGSFCVVGVSPGSSANFVVYSGSQSSSPSNSPAAGQPSSSWGKWNGANPSAGYNAAGSPGGSYANAVSITAAGGGLGGQFFAASGSSSPTTSVTTTTQITNSGSITSPITAATLTSSITFYTANVTSAIPTGPTGQPYYSLFNTSTPITTSASTSISISAPLVSETSKGTQTSSVALATATGGASRVGMGAVGFAVALWSLLQ